MAEEEPSGRRTKHTWTEKIAFALPWVNLLLAIQQIVERWTHSHL
ncbi:hypothetical protein [Streptomyces sp. NBC_00989]|nr:hypothetical protein OG714_33595 [Streptomyces sp. NBC_00989]